MVVAAGEQAGPGRRAERGDVEAVVRAGRSAASRSMLGVSMSEPKHPSCPKPRSSSTIEHHVGRAGRRVREGVVARGRVVEGQAGGHGGRHRLILRDSVGRARLPRAPGALLPPRCESDVIGVLGRRAQGVDHHQVERDDDQCRGPVRREDPEEGEERLHHGRDDPDDHAERGPEEHHDPGEGDDDPDDQVDPSPGVEVAAAEQQRVGEVLLDPVGGVECPQTVDRHVATGEDHHGAGEDDPSCAAPTTRRSFDHDHSPFVTGVTCASPAQ